MGLCKHLHAWHFSAGPSCRMQRGAADQHSADRPRWEGGSGCTGFSCLKWDRGSSPWPSLFIAYTALCFNDQLIIVSILVTPCIPLFEFASWLSEASNPVTWLYSIEWGGLKRSRLVKKSPSRHFYFWILPVLLMRKPVSNKLEDNAKGTSDSPIFFNKPSNELDTKTFEMYKEI